MNEPSSILPESLACVRLSRLINQLQDSRSIKLKDSWLIQFSAAGYGATVILFGYQFFMVYCGAVILILLFHALGEQRSRRQVDVLVKIVHELEENGGLIPRRDGRAKGTSRT